MKQSDHSNAVSYLFQARAIAKLIASTEDIDEEDYQLAATSIVDLADKMLEILDIYSLGMEEDSSSHVTTH